MAVGFRASAFFIQRPLQSEKTCPARQNVKFDLARLVKDALPDPGRVA